MTQEDKELLLKDICARLPYRPIVRVLNRDSVIRNIPLSSGNIAYVEKLEKDWWTECKPFLRPMSSMTEEEMDKIEEILGDKCIFDFMGNGDVSLHQGNFTQNILSKLYDFYNSIHVDYRGLIEKGLAIEAPEGMYK